MPRLPSLALLAEVAAAELAAQERRADALDSKAAVLLGFAGVLVPLTLSSLNSVFAVTGAGFATIAAACAASAAMPLRSASSLRIRQLRDDYPRSNEEFTRLRLLDTHCRVRRHRRYACRTMTNDPAGEEGKRLPPPLFDPDPSLIGSRDGSKRAMRKFQRSAERMRREALEAHLAELKRSGGDAAGRGRSD